MIGTPKKGGRGRRSVGSVPFFTHLVRGNEVLMRRERHRETGRERETGDSNQRALVRRATSLLFAREKKREREKSTSKLSFFPLPTASLIPYLECSIEPVRWIPSHPISCTFFLPLSTLTHEGLTTISVAVADYPHHNHNQIKSQSHHIKSHRNSSLHTYQPPSQPVSPRRMSSNSFPLPISKKRKIRKYSIM